MNPTFLMSDAAIASGQAFLNGELEKRNMEINMPLATFTWGRDIPVETGGGAIEYVSNMFAEFATSGQNEDGIINSATNIIPIIQANLSKDLAKVFPWANNLRMTFLDVQKLMAAGRGLDDILNTGLRMSYNKTLDKNVYTGFTVYGTTGLLNNASVSSALVAQNAAASSRLWTAKTPSEILRDVNDLIYAVWAASEFTEFPNQILLPTSQFNYISTQLISTAGNQSIMSYLMQNNLSSNNGIDLKIVPCRQCNGAGAGPSDRMVGYVNRKDRLQFNIPIVLTKGLTEASVQQMAYLTNFFAFFSEVQIKYFQTIAYRDGI